MPARGCGWLCSSSTQPYSQNIKAYDEYSTLLLLTTGVVRRGADSFLKMMLRRRKERFKFVREIQAAVKIKIAREIHVLLPATSVMHGYCISSKIVSFYRGPVYFVKFFRFCNRSTFVCIWQLLSNYELIRFESFVSRFLTQLCY